MDGNVFNIQRFTINDGPGIRTTVFLKGCNLRCKWCHNPESYKPKKELQFFEQLCSGCNACVSVCTHGAIRLNKEGEKVFDRQKCVGCGDCTDVCFSDALVLVGDRMSVDEVVETVLKDRSFYENSGGGLTISGGEPMLQKDFVKAVFTKTKAEGLHNALDTAADIPWTSFEEVLPVTDLVLLDLKVMDHEAHFRHTGVYNHLILENAVKLSEADVAMIVRIPVIPGVNATEANMAVTAEFLKDFDRLVRVELLPYHSMGVDKHHSLGNDDHVTVYDEPSEVLMTTLAKCFEAQEIEVQIG